MEKNLIMEYLNNVAEKTQTNINHDDIDKEYIFTMRKGSDSVKLIFNYSGIDQWSIEIHPVNDHEEIREIYFGCKEDAVKAFQVFTFYYSLVVTENFKMF